MKCEAAKGGEAAAEVVMVKMTAGAPLLVAAIRALARLHGGDTLALARHDAKIGGAVNRPNEDVQTHGLVPETEGEFPE